MDGGRWRRVQIGGALAIACSSLLLLALRATRADVPFLPPSPDAPWIMPPLPVSSDLQQWGRADAPVASFTRWIARPPPDAGPVRVRVRALRRFELFWNGERVASSSGNDWREETVVYVGALAREGGNAIRVDVAHRGGPPLLSLRIEGLGAPIVSDRDWEVSLDGAALGPAAPADDTRVHPATYAVETPLEALRERSDAILLLFALGVAGAAVARSRRGAPLRRLGPRLPELAFAAVCLAWLGLYVGKFSQIPLDVGFDARHHRAYVQWLLEHRTLPLATDGWSTYHPPLFYAAAAVLATVGEALAGAPELAVKLLPFLAGLGNAWLALALARRLFPEDPAVRTLACVFAGVLPMNVYSAAYFSNEAPHGFLAGAALLATVAALVARRASLTQALAMGGLFGLAALTKFTALALVPVGLFFLAAKVAVVERAGARAAALSAVAALSLAAVAGWFYVRSWVLLGAPIVGNWNLPGETTTWWQQPGFHTAAYYLGFGESLAHPYLAGFHSFWDGIYSTLWGDGGIAGRVFPADRHPAWSYPFMSAGYLAALPATALLAAGAVCCAGLAFDPRVAAGRRAALSFLCASTYAILFAIAWMTLGLPFFAQAKAFYGLALTPVLGVFLAVGTAWCDRALRTSALRAVFAGVVTAVVGVFLLAFAA